MGRDRMKYQNMVIFRGRGDNSALAQIEFLNYVKYYKERTGEKPKTEVRPKSGERKFDEFIVILG